MATPYVDPEDPGDAPAPDVPGNTVPQQYSKAFMQFLKTVAASTGDLSALTCPSFLLSSTSLVEYSAYWADYPKLFAAIPKSTSEEGRMVAVLRWFVSTLSGSYYSRCSKGFEKKPYNPVLGEQFFCSFSDVDSSGETKLASEQVCHHPPISGFYLENSKAGVFLNGHCGQKSSFKGTSIKVEQTGRVILRTRDHKEIYLITYPDIHIRSLYTGSPFLELTGDCTIRATSGLIATLSFVPKPWFSGTYHQFNAKIVRTRDLSDVLYTATGRWMAKSTITNMRTNSTETLFDAEASPMAERIVTPIEQQSPLESRKLWLKVTQAIESGNYSSATEEKKLIEEVQRAAKRDRDGRGEAWIPRLFHFAQDEGSTDDVNGFLSDNDWGSNGRELSRKEKKKEAKEREAAEVAPGDGGSWVYNDSLHLKE